MVMGPPEERAGLVVVRVEGDGVKKAVASARVVPRVVEHLCLS